MISIARDYTDTPAGRNRTDGPFSGERFRDEILAPALRHGEVEVDLDGVLGFGSSFLEEAFGGLIRLGFPLTQLRRDLRIHSSLDVYKERIWRYIESESRRRAH
ncbi:conserved protein of unknown function [Ralstonia solanacearum CMR15]|nr:conserved protein of unknown function [Ralstonia solanacearum CMR15]